jgi:hypothetical protein
VHETTLGGCLVGVALEEADAVDDGGGPELLHDDAEVDGIRVADLAEVAARHLGHHPDRVELRDVGAGTGDQVVVDDRVDQLEVAGVVHVPVHVDVGPAGGVLLPVDVVGARRPRGALAHGLPSARAVRCGGVATDAVLYAG